jgi:hypothetical protein
MRDYISTNPNNDGRDYRESDWEQIQENLPTRVFGMKVIHEGNVKDKDLTESRADRRKHRRRLLAAFCGVFLAEGITWMISPLAAVLGLLGLIVVKLAADGVL